MTIQGKRVFRNPRLTPQEEQKIRKLLAEGDVTRSAIAQRFNTSRENVRRVAMGK